MQNGYPGRSGRDIDGAERLARGLSPEDPLVTSLTELGRRFPLSCAGSADQTHRPTYPPG